MVGTLTIPDSARFPCVPPLPLGTRKTLFSRPALPIATHGAASGCFVVCLAKDIIWTGKRFPEKSRPPSLVQVKLGSSKNLAK